MNYSKADSSEFALFVLGVAVVICFGKCSALLQENANPELAKTMFYIIFSILLQFYTPDSLVI